MVASERLERDGRHLRVEEEEDLEDGGQRVQRHEVREGGRPQLSPVVPPHLEARVECEERHDKRGGHHPKGQPRAECVEAEACKGSIEPREAEADGDGDRLDERHDPCGQRDVVDHVHLGDDRIEAVQDAQLGGEPERSEHGRLGQPAQRRDHGRSALPSHRKHRQGQQHRSGATVDGEPIHRQEMGVAAFAVSRSVVGRRHVVFASDGLEIPRLAAQAEDARRAGSAASLVVRAASTARGAVGALAARGATAIVEGVLALLDIVRAVRDAIEPFANGQLLQCLPEVNACRTHWALVTASGAVRAYVVSGDAKAIVSARGPKEQGA
mmetsp:Transcript_18656/g.37854  ORF Transcript_18656/g.37854 Transcript_18656/m.37854 type:complete len:326 (+) Transcript_18656:2039-3016(+)